MGAWMRCPMCGHPSVPGVATCTLCGSNLVDPTTGKPVAAPRRGLSPMLLGALGGGLVIVLVVGVIAYLSLTPGKSPAAAPGMTTAQAATTSAATAAAGSSRPASTTAPATTRPPTTTAPVAPPTTAAPTPSITSPAVVLPAGATACPATFDSPGAFYSKSVAANSMTSCPFAESVRQAYLASGAKGQPVKVNAFSPVTSKAYDMACTGAWPTTCTGGNNAVVLLY